MPRERYFVAHANVRNAIKPAPIAVQTHTDMTIPRPRFPNRRSNWHFACRLLDGFAVFASSACTAAQVQFRQPRLELPLLDPQVVGELGNVAGTAI